MTEKELKRARDTAYRLLAYRPRSKRELTLRLEKKGFPDDVIEEVIKRLGFLGYIDDDAYARTVADSLLQRKFLGKETLRAELLQKGIEREVVERTIEESYIERDEDNIARAALEKRWKALEEKPIEVAKRRASDFLKRRGFSFRTVKKVLDEKFGMIKEG